MKLVIVESPTKSHTFKRYLGEEYEILPSVGHIRDLATSGKGGLGVDIENDFTARYVINKDKATVVRSLEKAAKKADEVILATDPDREGEAIAWHLATVLKLPIESTKRLEFHEITRESIAEAMEKPRTIDMKLVSSQETRRVLDRIIGFKLSSLLYKKIRSRSAGRVQSAALKLICDHEKEINAFKPEEYWSLNVDIEIKGVVYNLALDRVDGKAVKIKNEQEMKDILARLETALTISSIKVNERVKTSKDPFTTSTLQQEAFNRFNFRTKKTTVVAQKLYEGLAVENGENVGLITYMRTDSTRLSDSFINRASNYISENFGKEYINPTQRNRILKETEQVQDAHEAIRPTSTHRTPESIKSSLSKDEYNLYRLIYARAMASLMAPRKEEVTVITFSSQGLDFKLEGVHTLFEGYAKVMGDLETNRDKELPVLSEGEAFIIKSKTPKQNFTKAPPRYNEAKLVKLMEELGIGRPSTYASTIETILARKYVTGTGGILTPTDQGMLTNSTLEENFPDLIDAKYTADMEKQLDEIAEGELSRVEVLKNFYYPFEKLVEAANTNIDKIAAKETGELCPECGSPLVIRKGRYGEFVGCSNYPTCHYIKPQPKDPPKFTGENCPLCGKPLVERKDRKGRPFVGCSGYPACHYIKGNENKVPPVYTEKDYVKKCPDCEDGHLVVKKSKYGNDYLGCTNFPKCRHMEYINKKK